MYIYPHYRHGDALFIGLVYVIDEKSIRNSRRIRTVLQKTGWLWTPAGGQEAFIVTRPNKAQVHITFHTDGRWQLRPE